jgi:membrane protein implicated in regulation of membrane protease activity
MRIGFGVFLFTIGAIFAFATHWHISGLDLHVVGVILMLVGVVSAAIAANLYRSQRHGSTLTQRRQVADGSAHPGDVVYEERTSYDQPPVSGEQWPTYDEATRPKGPVTYPADLGDDSPPTFTP